MRDALRAEATKLRTLPGTAGLLLAAVVLTVAVSTLAAATACPQAACAVDPVRTSLTGVAFGQAIVAVFAVRALGGEQGMLPLTFAAMPRRVGVLAAKAILVSLLVAVSSAAAVVLSLWVGRLLLPSSLSYGDSVGRAAVGSVLYLVLIGLLGLGASAFTRDSAAAVGAVLGLLYVLPIVAAALSDPDWQRHLQQVAPMSSGLAVQATQDLSELPIGPWAGLGVLGLWAFAALGLGASSLSR